MKHTRLITTADGSGRIAVLEENIPSPGPDEVLIETTCSLISPSTELGSVKLRRETPDTSFPVRPFGYQSAGKVIGFGAGAEKRYSLGQRVACMGANYAQHATHTCVPVNLCAPIPDSVTDEEAAFNHLAATALQAIRRAEPLLGESFLILGLGLVGQLSAQLGRLNGCRIAASDTEENRLELARALGAHLALSPRDPDFNQKIDAICRGHGVDGAIICFGGDATAALQQILGVLKKTRDTHQMGRIVIVGGATITQRFPTALGNVDIRASCRTGFGYHDKGWERGADYPPVTVPWDTQRNLEECLRLIEEGRLHVKPLITHRFPLRQAPEACDLLIERPNEAVGVIFNMQ